ncbi:TrmB family transcriptional regulator [Treponema sp.]|uniref:TrmB family transcriptional regulator n=1 Tax=Treponema sp. TaxID=166 RepID=UPI003890390B
MQSSLIENLTGFGLSRQEALVYTELLKFEEATGYEISKATGISRSNVYSALAELVNKGACYLNEAESLKYVPVNPEQFLNNTIENLKLKSKEILKQIPPKVEKRDGYITVKGYKNIMNKIFEMLDKAEKRVYVMAPQRIIEEISDRLQKLIKGKKKIVILSDGSSLAGSVVYKTKINENQIRFIADSSYVLTGEINGTNEDTCLYSGQKNLVELMKEALKNKITLIEQGKD